MKWCATSVPKDQRDVQKLGAKEVRVPPRPVLPGGRLTCHQHIQSFSIVWVPFQPFFSVQEVCLSMTDAVGGPASMAVIGITKHLPTYIGTNLLHLLHIPRTIATGVILA